jgi:hypothetical protein
VVHLSQGEEVVGGPGLLDEDEDEEHFVSSYEKAHPLEVPRALTEVREGGRSHAGSRLMGSLCWYTIAGALLWRLGF